MPTTDGMTSNSPRSVETPLGVLLLLAALATAAVGLWLLWVCAMVLPSRDPAHLPMWRVVAVAFLAYAALSVASVAARLAWLRGSLLALSLGATALGACGIVAMLQQAGRGGHFEGYLVLMGLVLTGHGLFGTLFALRARTGTTPANA